LRILPTVFFLLCKKKLICPLKYPRRQFENITNLTCSAEDPAVSFQKTKGKNC
jgi:hypothetical protein